MKEMNVQLGSHEGKVNTLLADFVELGMDKLRLGADEVDFLDHPFDVEQGVTQVLTILHGVSDRISADRRCCRCALPRVSSALRTGTFCKRQDS